MLLANDCELGVVIRRGPSNHVATFLWERTHDVFRLGEWRKGRLYERRADISPDGKHLVYLVSNYDYAAKDAGAWTNISKVPYLKPLDLYRTPTTYEGGGLFLSNSTYCLHAI